MIIRDWDQDELVYWNRYDTARSTLRNRPVNHADHLDAQILKSDSRVFRLLVVAEHIFALSMTPDEMSSWETLKQVVFCWYLII